MRLVLYEKPLCRILLIGMLYIPFMTGCNETTVLSEIRPYFPAARIIRYQQQPDVLHIETHVHGVSELFVLEAFTQFAQKYINQPLVSLWSWPVIVVGFDDYNVVWRLKKGGQYKIFSREELSTLQGLQLYKAWIR